MNFTEDTSMFIEDLKRLDLTLSEEQLAQFLRFYEMLTEKNKVMNLTAITDFGEVVTKHFLDSLLILKAVRPEKLLSLRVLDLGTGAGFPGIPLKIALPELNITLADSLNKRVLFLNEVIQELGLKKIDTVHARAEDLGKDPAYREKYGLVVSRAVANLSSLSEYCLPFVRIGGLFVSYKSVDIMEEYVSAQKAIKVMGGGKSDIQTYQLPGTDLSRSFVLISKKTATPKKYPRRAGLPSKDPIS